MQARLVAIAAIVMLGIIAIAHNQAFALDGVCVKFCGDGGGGGSGGASGGGRGGGHSGPSIWEQQNRAAEQARNDNLWRAYDENKRCTQTWKQDVPSAHRSASSACEKATNLCFQNQGGVQCRFYKANYLFTVASIYDDQGDLDRAIRTMKEAVAYCQNKTQCSELKSWVGGLTTKKESKAQQANAARNLASMRDDLARLSESKSRPSASGLEFFDPRDSQRSQAKSESTTKGSSERTSTAGAQAKSAKQHSEFAASMSGTAAKEDAGKGFDTAGDYAGSLGAVDLRGMAHGIEIPPELADDPVVKKYVADIAKNDAQHASIENELETVRAKMEMAAPSEKSTLAVEEARLKQERSNVEQKQAFNQYKLKERISITVGADWKKKAAGQPASQP